MFKQCILTIRWMIKMSMSSRPHLRTECTRASISSTASAITGSSPQPPLCFSLTRKISSRRRSRRSTWASVFQNMMVSDALMFSWAFFNEYVHHVWPFQVQTHTMMPATTSSNSLRSWTWRRESKRSTHIWPVPQTQRTLRSCLTQWRTLSSKRTLRTAVCSKRPLQRYASSYKCIYCNVLVWSDWKAHVLKFFFQICSALSPPERLDLLWWSCHSNTRTSTGGTNSTSSRAWSADPQHNLQPSEARSW